MENLRAPNSLIPAHWESPTIRIGSAAGRQRTRREEDFRKERRSAARSKYRSRSCAGRARDHDSPAGPETFVGNARGPISMTYAIEKSGGIKSRKALSISHLLLRHPKETSHAVGYFWTSWRNFTVRPGFIWGGIPAPCAGPIRPVKDAKAPSRALFDLRTESDPPEPPHHLPRRKTEGPHQRGRNERERIDQ